MAPLKAVFDERVVARLPALARLPFDEGTSDATASDDPRDTVSSCDESSASSPGEHSEDEGEKTKAHSEAEVGAAMMLLCAAGKGVSRADETSASRKRPASALEEATAAPAAAAPAASLQAAARADRPADKVTRRAPMSSTHAAGLLATNTGRWSDKEHRFFLKGLELYGPGAHKEIQKLVPTRSLVQIRTHAQKYFLREPHKKLAKPEGGAGYDDEGKCCIGEPAVDACCDVGGGWWAKWDRATRAWFFVHQATSVTQWDTPNGVDPVRLPPGVTFPTTPWPAPATEWQNVFAAPQTTISMASVH